MQHSFFFTPTKPSLKQVKHSDMYKLILILKRFEFTGIFVQGTQIRFMIFVIFV